MTKLEFISRLKDSGVTISSDSVNIEYREFETDYNANIVLRDGSLYWTRLNSLDPFKVLLQKAIDFDQWKHSWHMQIVPENYENITQIIQGKILDRLNEVKELLSIYNQLDNEKGKVKIDELND